MKRNGRNVMETPLFFQPLPVNSEGDIDQQLLQMWLAKTDFPGGLSGPTLPQIENAPRRCVLILLYTYKYIDSFATYES